jgi:prepilin-type N-terminal cleavage/methylation domain-containing protein
MTGAYMHVRKAFTLIEILVVIAIIATLMSLLLAVINTTQAEIAASMSTIQQLSGNIEVYKTMNGKYPLTKVAATDFSNTDAATIASRNHELRVKLVSISAEYDSGGEFFYATTEAYAEPTPAILGTAPATADCIVDAWNSPLVYKPYTAYLVPPTGFPTTGADKYAPPKIRSYQIWSPGENEQYEMNSANADLATHKAFETDPDKLDDSSTLVIFDDITNWTKVSN